MLLRTFMLSFILLFSLSWAKTYYDLFLQGHQYEEIKAYPQAIAAYRQSIQLEPGFAPAYNALGFVYLELKDHATARQYFQKTLSLDKDYVLALLNMGASYYRDNELAQAQQYFLEVLQRSPKNPRALTNMAAVKYRYGDYWGTWDYYNRAKTADEAYLKERYNKEKTLAEIRAQRKKDPENFQLKILEEKVIREEIYLP